jgi:hypothetical protein
MGFVDPATLGYDISPWLDDVQRHAMCVLMHFQARLVIRGIQRVAELGNGDRTKPRKGTSHRTS